MEEECWDEGEILLKKYSSSKHGQDLSDSEDAILHFTQIELEDRHLHQPVVNSLSNGGQGPSHPSSSSTGNTCILILAAAMASLGGMLFGYDIGIISGAVLQLQDTFCLSCFQREFVISSMLIGAIIGSITGGFLIDVCGRRLTIIMNSVIFVVGALILSLSQTYVLLIIGRLVVGFAVSVSAIGEVIYISEIAPSKKRGLLVSLNELGITLGLLLAYLINFLFIQVPNGWRFMFGLSALPAFFQGLGMWFLPKSPRYLMLRKQENKAEEVLFKLRGGNVDKEIASIKMSITAEANHNCIDLCGSKDNMRSRMLIGAGLVFFQQFTGQPNVLYYAPTIFEAIGFENHSASTLATVGLGVVKVTMTLCALLCVDKWGRRKFLILGASLMGVAVLCLGLVIHLDNRGMESQVCTFNITCEKGTSADGLGNHHMYLLQNQTSIDAAMIIETEAAVINLMTTANNLINTTSAGSTAPPVLLHGSMAGKIIAFLSLMVYVAAYAIGFGPISWLVLSEIFPAGVKGRAIGLATVLNWGTNLVVSFFFLDLMNVLGVSVTFFLFCCICGISIVFIFVFVPETKGRSLEQISVDLNKRVPATGARIRIESLWCCKPLRTEIALYPKYKPVTDIPMTTQAVG